MVKKITAISFILLAIVFAYWYNFIALKQVPMSQANILQKYVYQYDHEVILEMAEIEPRLFTFTFKSFDGSIVNGQISYPQIKAEKYPVLIGVSAMGRGAMRWWVDSFKGRPTVTQVNKISKLADSKGYVVVAIDARFHGQRKKPERTLRSIMNDLHFFGDKTDYEAMIRDTVLDYRVLLDWVEQQDNLDSTNTKIAGYSMGGQIALILGSLDERIEEVISIVPPYIDDKMAMVAPKNFISLLQTKKIMFVSANDDENASAEENDNFYNLIPSDNKQRLDFEGGHILPDDYVDKLSKLF